MALVPFFPPLASLPGWGVGEPPGLPRGEEGERRKVEGEKGRERGGRGGEREGERRKEEGEKGRERERVKSKSESYRGSSLPVFSVDGISSSTSAED